ncbi:MAG: hypothetical protein QXJ07_04445 [Candidatus Bathyarchaeia archaeon]
MSNKDEQKIEGWVEIIVKDKNGKIKYHIGSSKPPTTTEPPKEHDCPNPTILSALPAKFQDFYWRKNIITNIGLACIIRLVFAGLTEDKFGYLAIGTGTTAESANDTALQNEVKRKTATVTQTTTTVTGDTALLEATFSSADTLSGTMTISEAGIFNASSGGDLLARKVFSGIPINWDAGDTLTIRYFVQMTR